MTITALRDMHIEVVTDYQDEFDSVDTNVEVITSNDVFKGDILEDRHDYFDFQFEDGSVAFGLEKKLWNIGAE